MFIILGILILVVSFVVALVTLLREQKNLENTTVNSKIDKVQSTEVVKEVIQVETPLPQDTPREIGPNLPVELREQKTRNEEFSWKNDQSYDNNIANEQQKILEIRQEIMKIAGEKIPKQGLENFEVDKQPKNTSEILPESVGVANKLTGEILLRGVGSDK